MLRRSGCEHHVSGLLNILPESYRGNREAARHGSRPGNPGSPETRPVRASDGFGGAIWKLKLGFCESRSKRGPRQFPICCPVRALNCPSH